MKWTGLLETTKVVDTSVSQEALKCLSNCILLSGDTMKSWLIETKNALDTCARLLHSDTVSVDIQFLICRLLYLMTYDGPFIIDILMDLDLPHALYKASTDSSDLKHVNSFFPYIDLDKTSPRLVTRSRNVQLYTTYITTRHPCM